jgi:folate-binding protein YgfZ
MLLWADGDGIIVDADAARGADLARRLTLYRLRAQIAVEDVTSQRYALYAPAQFEGARPDPRFPDGALGWRATSSGPGSPADGAAAYDAHRLALGVPDLACDAAPEEVFALEALLEELNGVDFQKGCFVGQENVSRMKRRATTRRKFCPIVFDGEAPRPGAPVMAGAAELGSVRSGRPGRAIALLRLDRALAAEAAGQALSAEGRKVRLDPPPWLILPGGERDSAPA